MSHPVTVRVGTRAGKTPDVFLVDWQVNAKRGRFRVTVTPPLEDRGTAAELAVVHHLLSVREMAGERRTGRNITIRFSRGACKRLLQRQSSKTELFPYSAALENRFSLAAFEVDAPKDVLDLGPLPIHPLVVEHPPVEAVATPGVGKVVITRHALEQLDKRVHADEGVDLYKRLRRRLENGKWIPATLPSHVLAMKKARHEVDAEFFTDGEDCYLVVIPAEPRSPKVLTTLYFR